MSNCKMKNKNIARNKDLKEKWCKFCERWKRLEDYSTNGKCLECRRKHKKQQIKFEIKEIGLAAHLLKNSCCKAFYRCGKKQGYENVKCKWKNYHYMFEDLKNNSLFFKEWQKQTKKYEEGNFIEGLRPTLDRILSNGPYSLNNIQCLSLEENRLKAKNAATHVFFNDENGVLCYDSFVTVKEVAKKLGVNYTKLRRNRDIKRPIFVDGNRYFIQSAK